MRLANAREGEVVRIRERPATFSFFPTYHKTRREGVHSTLFATDPWNIIRHNIEKIKNDSAKRQALAFFAQSRDFFTAAQNSDVTAAKPLLLYYSFLNLAKCFIVKHRGTVMERVKHGLLERSSSTGETIHGHVLIDIPQNPEQHAFAMFAEAIGAPLPESNLPNRRFQINSQDFLGQILIGHRIFCQAENITEKFISLNSIEYMQDVTKKKAWVRVRAYDDDFTRLGYFSGDLSRNLGDQGAWRNVKCSETIDTRDIIKAETTKAIDYSYHPSQILLDISNNVRSRLWRSVTAYPPYRKYYIYKPDSEETILNQLLTIYLATFYFGSITRYKPDKFEKILKSSIGPFVFEFFSNQPTQFLYLMASEYVEQEIAKAAIT